MHNENAAVIKCSVMAEIIRQRASTLPSQVHPLSWAPVLLVGPSAWNLQPRKAGRGDFSHPILSTRLSNRAKEGVGVRWVGGGGFRTVLVWVRAFGIIQEATERERERERERAVWLRIFGIIQETRESK